jgi:hypothetical protein
LATIPHFRAARKIDSASFQLHDKQ